MISSMPPDLTNFLGLYTSLSLDQKIGLANTNLANTSYSRIKQSRMVEEKLANIRKTN
jgi:hypothetical protein